MKIIIDYEASWRNVFLDGSNNVPLPKRGRKFIASSTNLKKTNGEFYKSRKVTQDTVLGILSRLIGDQRKLYQAKQSLEEPSFYFNEFLNKISFEDNAHTEDHEIAYIRNMSGNTDQNTFTGLIKANDPVFQSDYSSHFWSVLFLDFEQLCNFIIHNTLADNRITLEPTNILHRMDEIKKIKPIEYNGLAREASRYLADVFEKYEPLNNKGLLRPMPMYCSALYLQLQRLEEKYDMSSAKTKAGSISGISKNGFTPKDFMDRYTTGEKKLVYGNPYIKEHLVKGVGKIKHTLIKASGQLTIHLDISLDKAIELKTMIDNAGVSSFYLGKKGLAYVSKIDIR